METGHLPVVDGRLQLFQPYLMYWLAHRSVMEFKRAVAQFDLADGHDGRCPGSGICLVTSLGR
jgi:hypothetical protein